MKNIKKIINEAEFIVQKKIGGWEGWNIYARHPKFSKYSVEIIQDKKPRLTKSLKEKIIEQAIDEKETEKYNEKFYSELSRSSHRSIQFQNDFLKGIMRSDKIFDIVRDALEKNCEYPEVNRVMQRMLDAKCEMEEYSKIGKQVKGYPSRKITIGK